MLKEFKDFAMRGNVMDLAIAVIIGGAFGKIIASLVKDILMPLIGLLLGGITFSELSGTVGDVVITYGLFIQAIVDFIVIAVVIFMLIRTINKTKEQPAPADPTTKECQYCFSTVPIKATRCPHCTSQL
ncbi:MAG TPA: large conductance mechanosensitive channel protein MscL [Anaerolineales bacterium]|nr:large conductance mechanosensitive channel protein MscL [Anaerolineales bacterium]